MSKRQYMNEPSSNNITQKTTEKEEINLNSSEYFINRHIGLMQFNLRVLEQALNEDYPLLERFQFLMIFNSNMDEFFEIRLAGLRRQVSFARETVSTDGMRPQDVLHILSEQIKLAMEKQYHILNDVLLPTLNRNRVRILNQQDWNKPAAKWAESKGSAGFSLV